MVISKENRITLFGTKIMVWGAWIILLFHLSSVIKEVMLLFELKKDKIEPYFSIFLFFSALFIANLWWKKYYKLEKDGNDYKLTRSFSFRFSDQKMPAHVFLAIIYVIWIILFDLWLSLLEAFYSLVGLFYSQFYLFFESEVFSFISIVLSGAIGFIVITNFSQSIRKRFLGINFWIKVAFIILLFLSLIIELPLD